MAPSASARLSTHVGCRMRVPVDFPPRRRAAWRLAARSAAASTAAPSCAKCQYPSDRRRDPNRLSCASGGGGAASGVRARRWPASCWSSRYIYSGWEACGKGGGWGGLRSWFRDFPDDDVALSFVRAGVIIRDARKQVRDWSLGQGGSDGAASQPSHGAPKIPPGMRVARRGPKIAHAHRDGSLFIYFIAGGGGEQDVARSWEFWLVVQGRGRLETVSSMCHFRHSAHVTLMTLSSPHMSLS
jgi:hypothetical protein